MPVNPIFFGKHTKEHNMIKLLEDNSPYYSKIYFNEIIEIQKILRNIDMNSLVNAIPNFSVVRHPKLSLDVSRMIINSLPFKDDFNWKTTIIFLTNPGKQSIVHKDGPGKFTLNISFDIKDDKCITKWYTDKLIEENNLGDQSIHTKHPKGNLYQIIKTSDDLESSKEMIMGSDEALLFNTSIWHRFDNRKSANQRGIVCIRTDDDTTYEQAKDKIFKYIG